MVSFVGQRDKVRSFSSTWTKINSRWLKELNIKHEAIKKETSKVVWIRE
jgi:hypothetical protein